MDFMCLNFLVRVGGWLEKLGIKLTQPSLVELGLGLSLAKIQALRKKNSFCFLLGSQDDPESSHPTLDSPQGVTVSGGVAVAGGHDQEHGALPHVQG